MIVLANLKRLKIQSRPKLLKFINISKERVYSEWNCDYPPTVSSVSATLTTTKTTSSSFSSTSTTTTTPDTNIPEANIDTLVAKKIKNTLLLTQRIEAFEIITTKSSGFTTDSGEDITLKGKTGTDDKWFWDGESSTMFVDANVEIRESCITLNGSRLLTSVDKDRTIGIIFNYWDTGLVDHINITTNSHIPTTAKEEIGWFGFDPVDHCFKFLLDVVLDETGIYEGYPCQQASGISGKISTDTFVARNLVNDSLIDGENNDLNITTTTNLQVTAIEGIDNDSATYTVQTTNGTIISNTGTEGIDILSTNGPIDIISTNAQMNIQNINNNMTVNVTTGNMEISVDNGDLDISVNGSSTGQDLTIAATNQSCILMTSACNNAQAILINATAGGIDITAQGAPGEDIDIFNNQGSINITAQETHSQALCLIAPNGGLCIQAGNIIDIDSSNDITVDAANITLTVPENGDIVLNGASKSDFKNWISYKTFDVSCGYWQSLRDTSHNDGYPVYYWRKVPKNETVYLNLDLDNPFRLTTGKGFKLTSIVLAYEIETIAITSITSTIIQKTFTENTTVTLTQIPTTNALDTSVDQHYDTITITNPSYLNTESVLNLEIELVTPATSVFKFYGAMVYYEFDAI